MDRKHILYLRTDLGAKDLIGGGSVAHTLGVIYGLKQLGHSLTVVSSDMHGLLNQKVGSFYALHMPIVRYRLGSILPKKQFPQTLICVAKKPVDVKR